MEPTIRSILLFLTAILFFGSCERTLFIDVSETEPKIVMNGILSPNSGLWLNVSESSGTSTPIVTSFEPVEDATVRVFLDSDPVLSITENNRGNYFSTDFSPLVDEMYEIRVSAEGMPEASAMVTIPQLVEIDRFDTSTVVRDQAYRNQVLYKNVDFFLNFRFRDPANSDDYYMLGVYYLENNEYHTLQVDTEDLVMNIHIKDGIEVLAWEDNSFNGETREFDVRFNMQNYEGFETRILVSLYSIQEDYFDYLKTYSQNYTVLNDDGLLYEPVQVSTNITGGYGVVAAVSASELVIGYTF